MTDKSLEQMQALEKVRASDAYLVELAKTDFSINLNRLRREKKMKLADFARVLRKSPSYITKIFKGDENLTIESMVKLARAADTRLKISFEPQVISSNSFQGATPISNHPKWGSAMCFASGGVAANSSKNAITLVDGASIEENEVRVA